MAWPRVKAFLTALRQDKASDLPIGVAGFCWGGLHAIKLAHENEDTRTPDGKPLADAIFSAHASNVGFPADIEQVARNLSYAGGDADAVMGIAQFRQMQQILGSKPDVPSEVILYPGAQHGFAVRASKAVPDSKETQQSEEAEKQAVAWFQKQFEAVREKYTT